MLFVVMTKAILGLVLLSAALTAACGSSDGGSQPTLDGIWQVQLANGCTGTYSFKGSAFGDNVICTLQNGNYGVQIEDGTFSKTANEIDFMPAESSCPAGAGAFTAGYLLQNGQLWLTLASTQIVFSKAVTGPVSGGAVIEDGCWDFSQSPARFTPGAITKL